MMKLNQIPAAFPKIKALVQLLQVEDADHGAIAELMASAQADELEADKLVQRADFTSDRDIKIVDNLRVRAEMKRHRAERTREKIAQRRFDGQANVGEARGELHDAALALGGEMFLELFTVVSRYVVEGAADAAARDLFLRTELGQRVEVVEQRARGDASFPEGAREFMALAEDLFDCLTVWANRHPSGPAPTVNKNAA